MKQSAVFLYTLHDAPSDSEVPSHRLLAQAGFIHKLAAGIYSYTPPMWRVLQKISDIVREEMNRAGAQEVLLPALQPRSIWDESGRWDRYVKDGVLFHFTDRKDSEVCLGPTHEEAVTTLVSKFVNSYKQLPLNLYQIQTKFRDEIRPRFGLMRGREFIMKDAYSFDIDDEGMNESYRKMDEAYRRIFTRCGLEFTAVEADSGAIGGSGSQEFVVTAQTGEDLFILCDAVGYAANVEKAVSIIPPAPSANESPKTLEKVATSGVKTIEDLTRFFAGLTSDRFLKAVVYRAVWKDTEEIIVALIRGDREINEVKLANKLDCMALVLATDDEIRKALGAAPGFIGPVGSRINCRIFADYSVRDLKNFVTGANEVDAHYSNANWDRDCPLPEVHDLLMVQEGDLLLPRNSSEAALPEEKRRLRATRGIEVGHIFKLGRKYSAAMKAHFTNATGQAEPFVMGCYGIGVSRVAASAIEQWHDEKGMIWPLQIAPWQVHLVCVNAKSEEQRSVADKIYAELTQAGLDVLYDDRQVSPGVKFNDADLIGLPLRITVGRDAAQGVVEFVQRKQLNAVAKVNAAEIISAVEEAIKN